MSNHSVARRFFEAAQEVSSKAWHPDSTPEFLLRIGFPGLMTRLGFSRSADVEQGFHRLQKLYHTILFEAAEQISFQLTRSGIEHFFAKGLALLNRYYEPGDRTISDMDIYIARKARVRCIELLRDLGYMELTDENQVGPSELRSSIALTRETDSAIKRHAIDLHWSLDPVERLLPRSDREFPSLFWKDVDTTGSIATPTPEVHATILTHHLVHTDLLHARNLLDLAHVFADIPENGGNSYLRTCDELRIGSFANEVCRVVQRDLDVDVPPAFTENRPRSKRISWHLSLTNILALSARAHPHHDEAITLRRIMRRLKLVDAGCTRTLLEDLFSPPKEFLMWRWPGRGIWGARRKHYIQLLRKALGR